MLDDFYRGTLAVERLNYGVVTLIPKCQDEKQIKQFRPIYLCNVSFKILTKVLINRLTKIASVVISKTQTTFLKERYIMEGVLMLHETAFYKIEIIFRLSFENRF